MCNFKSFVVTRTDILHSQDSDSHEDIIAANGLSDAPGRTDFVRCELTPNGTTDWTWRVDQDIRPDWFSEREAEVACRDVVRRLLASGKMRCPGYLSLDSLTSLAPGCLPQSVGGYLYLGSLPESDRANVPEDLRSGIIR